MGPKVGSETFAELASVYAAVPFADKARKRRWAEDSLVLSRVMVCFESLG